MEDWMQIAVILLAVAAAIAYLLRRYSRSAHSACGCAGCHPSPPPAGSGRNETPGACDCCAESGCPGAAQPIGRPEN